LIDLDFELNGQPVRLRCAPDRRLLAILREDFGLTGAKPGCEIGRCGACMVWLDAVPVNACLVLAWQLAGRHVTSIEHLATLPASQPVQAALAQCGAVQCGYCSAGMVVSLTHLHARQPRPGLAEAQMLMAGNLCRCTGYGGLQRSLALLFQA
jgi:aerobic carbon-monoxide dehydrogenase small subunit